jgi:hypothetical protein
VKQGWQIGSYHSGRDLMAFLAEVNVGLEEWGMCFFETGGQV